MSASLIVATILVFGWNLTLIVTALLTGTGPFQSERQNSRQMSRSVKAIRAEVGKPELDARTEAWKREMGIGTVQSPMIDTQREVTVQAPYAEASVTVTSEKSDETRRCSLCLN